MPWMKWFPWRFFLRRVAQAHGFLDPVALLAKVRRFAEPAEVGEPVELLRAGMIFHARGLINARVIQHNLDWIWPYWVEQQFDPANAAFIPRAFSMTHCNLSHRNWTAIGEPDFPQLPLVDPRGLLTPHYDGWSLDAWCLPDNGPAIYPSKSPATRQSLELNRKLAVITRSESNGSHIIAAANVELDRDVPYCQLHLEACCPEGGWLAVALRPYNPEGISFIHRVDMNAEKSRWTVDRDRCVSFSSPAERSYTSDYRHGDVASRIQQREESLEVECNVGMATAAALYRLQPGRSRSLLVSTELEHESGNPDTLLWRDDSWNESQKCALRIPDRRFQFLYDAALRTLILHSPEEVYPGPYTYKRFWFRDAAFIIYALLCAGMTERAQRALDRFPRLQTRAGYFHSQEGEWDSNGEVLWIFEQFVRMSGTGLKPEWKKAMIKGARWIMNKRGKNAGNELTSGLLPAGFSAEHLGPPDYYYWDDFWGIAGLRAAAGLCEREHESGLQQEFIAAADDFQQCVDRSLYRTAERLGCSAMPASPNRRLDAGAIGSLAAGYPLRLYAPDHPPLLDTAEFLISRCFVKGGFFQDIIHSGINAYLTLHVAQVLLRAGDSRYFDLMKTVADLATETGQWPEAIHPGTGGGCMGDGQHSWASAEWVLMLRNCFVREENDRLVLVSGVPRVWLEGGQEEIPVAFGPALTVFGSISVRVGRPDPDTGSVTVYWSGNWHDQRPEIEIRLPGFQPATVASDGGFIELREEVTP